MDNTFSMYANGYIREIMKIAYYRSQITQNNKNIVYHQQQY